MHVRKWLVLSIAASLLAFAACGDDNRAGAPVTPASTDVTVDMPTGEPPDGDGASPFDLLFPLTGEWSGAWNNDTFGSSAPITIRIAVNNDGTASFAFDLPAADSGSPFGLIAIGLPAVDGTYDENGLSVMLRGDGLFGDMNVSISLEGDLIAEATMAGVPGISALIVRGSLDDTSMDIAYNIGLPDNSVATGRATLTKS